MTNLERFVAAYTETLIAQYGPNPRADARKMTLGLANGTANLGPAGKAAAKQLGIKPTYKAIRAFFAEDDKPFTVMKWFTASIEAAQLESAISLPGWSHAGPEYDKAVFWYPWKATFRKIYFKSAHRRQAAKDCDRAGLLVRDLTQV